ncbi:MAG: aspartate kinase [Longimicrobiales bacterium]
MALIVSKFGGTSVGTPDHIRRVAARLVRSRKEGNQVLAVVSAMGDTTDDLMSLALSVTPDPRRRHPRELDMLLTSGERIAMALTAMAIADLGVDAISLTGSQAAIITDETHTGARITEVRTERLREELDAGRIVIVAGFQGVSRTHEVTTLGRGGSDTTAVALAAALRADRCDIYTDVDGVFTADPRSVKDARMIPEIDYEEMIELASAGARVMHPRAVEIGARFNVPIRVLSSFRDNDVIGTLITKRTDMEQVALTGLASQKGYARLVLHGVPANLDAMGALLTALAANGVSVDFFNYADSLDGVRQLQVTIPQDDAETAGKVARDILGEGGLRDIEVRSDLSRVTLVGGGMAGIPGVYARAVEALRGENIDIYGFSTSAMSISVLVDAEKEERTLQLLHTAFDLSAAG